MWTVLFYGLKIATKENNWWIFCFFNFFASLYLKILKLKHILFRIQSISQKWPGININVTFRLFISYTKLALVLITFLASDFPTLFNLSPNLFCISYNNETYSLSFIRAIETRLSWLLEIMLSLFILTYKVWIDFCRSIICLISPFIKICISQNVPKIFYLFQFLIVNFSEFWLLLQICLEFSLLHNHAFALSQKLHFMSLKSEKWKNYFHLSFLLHFRMGDHLRL